MGAKEFALFLGVFGLWFVLNRWVLPRFGINTCMSGGCGTSCCRPVNKPSTDDGVDGPDHHGGDAR